MLAAGLAGLITGGGSDTGQGCPRGLQLEGTMPTPGSALAQSIARGASITCLLFHTVSGFPITSNPLDDHPRVGTTNCTWAGPCDHCHMPKGWRLAAMLKRPSGTPRLLQYCQFYSY